jgi:hypothetical protein
VRLRDFCAEVDAKNACARIKRALFKCGEVFDSMFRGSKTELSASVIFRTISLDGESFRTSLLVLPLIYFRDFQRKPSLAVCSIQCQIPTITASTRAIRTDLDTCIPYVIVSALAGHSF